MRKIERFLKKYPFYAGVIIITFYVGEFFPFSFYPMYNHFPNYSYTYYIQDSNNENITKKLGISHGDLTFLIVKEHDKNNFYFGNGKESEAEMQKTGIDIMTRLITSKRINLNTDTIYLYRIYNYIQSSIIQSDTSIISRMSNPSYEKQ